MQENGRKLTEMFATYLCRPEQQEEEQVFPIACAQFLPQQRRGSSGTRCQRRASTSYGGRELKWKALTESFR